MGGMAIIDWELEQQRHEALGHCHRILAAGAQTRQRLEEKLVAKGLADEIVEWAISRCLEQRLVDDAAYARLFVQQRLARGHGARRIRTDLLKRGVAEFDVAGAFEAVGEGSDDAVARCVDLVEKRFGRDDLGEMRVRAKAFRYLVGRGFDAAQAEQAIAAVRGQQASEAG